MKNKLLKRFNVLSIIITKQCNGFCDYCLISHTGNSKELKLLPFNNIEKIAEILNSFELTEHEKPYKIAIQLIGGEPLIHMEYLEKIMSYLIITCPFISFTFCIYTNGCSLTKDILLKLKNYPANLTISLDEVNSNTSSHRYFQNRPMFEVTKEKILMAMDIAPEIIRINTVISKNNYKQLYDIYNFILENKINKWGWGFMRSANPEDAEWNDVDFKEMCNIIETIVKDSLQKKITLYNVLEYSQVKHKNMTSENIPIYLNTDETISTINGDHCFRIPIMEFQWDKYFTKILEWPELYLLNGSGEENLTECIHCHYREKHLKNMLTLPLSQCRWSALLRECYNKYYKKEGIEWNK